MSVVADILKEVPLPNMVRIRQRFEATELTDVAGELQQQIRRTEISARVKENMRIAVSVGSRGIAELPLIVKTVVAELKRLGACPFIVPAMGSHGGATAAGQIEVLANLGITQDTAGCPIVSSMETVELGSIANGLPVLIDKNAYEADGIVVINRIKAQITIGLGKQKGADSCHAFGFGKMPEHIVEMTNIKLKKANFLFGVGTVENAYDKVSRIVVVEPKDIIETDKKLLLEAKRNLPRILFEPIEVLIVDQIGKEFSGGGMDCHIVGRASTTFVTPATRSPVKMAVLDITDNSHGNACGMGLADVTTRRLFNKIDFEITYPNIITSTATNSGRIPLIMESDRLAIQCAVKTCNVPDWNKLRMVRIPNSLRLEEIYISEAMLPEAAEQKAVLVLTEPAEFVFDSAGNLSDIGFGR
ncbi:MAG: hypothetical protein H6Q72_4295 [Firmicutes bacterium]|nr:hypothetical protein [Bacillota bacterium]